VHGSLGRFAEFVSKAVRHRLTATTDFIESASPWGTGSIESFKGKLRDELLNSELFFALREARIITERGGTGETTHARTSSSVDTRWRRRRSNGRILAQELCTAVTDAETSYCHYH